MSSSSTLCLSLPSTLRCAGLSRVQAIASVGPAAFEVLLSCVLVWAQWGKGWNHWFLVAETWIFFALAVMDLVAHIDNHIASSLSLFTTVDKALGVLSSIPLVCYVIFLLLFANAFILPSLSRRYYLIIKYTLAAFILPLAVVSEFGNLFGISYMQLRVAPDTKLGVGFQTEDTRMIWMFFTCTTLALLTIYQSSLFILALTKVIRDRSADNHPKNRPLGLICFAAGVSLGVVETILAFAGFGFEGIVARRSIKLVSRVLLGIAMITIGSGPSGFLKFGHSIEDAPAAPLKRPHGTIRGMISNPRTETFTHVSSETSGFYDIGAAGPLKPVIPLPRPPPVPPSTVSIPEDTSKRRVTVQYDGRQPPVLDVRFSDIDLSERPPPRTFGGQVSPIPEQRTPQSYSSIVTSPLRDSVVMELDQSSVYASRHRSVLHASYTSHTADSIHAVREIASQFPGPPPLASGKCSNQLEQSAPGTEDQMYHPRRKPPPPISPTLCDLPKSPFENVRSPPVPTPQRPDYESRLSEINLPPEETDYYPPSPKSKSTGKFSGYHHPPSKKSMDSRRTHRPSSSSGRDSFEFVIPERPRLTGRATDIDQRQWQQQQVLVEETEEETEAEGSQEDAGGNKRQEPLWLHRRADTIDTITTTTTFDSGIGGIPAERVKPYSLTNVRTTPAPTSRVSVVQSLYVDLDHFGQSKSPRPLYPHSPNRDSASTIDMLPHEEESDRAFVTRSRHLFTTTATRDSVDSNMY